MEWIEPELIRVFCPAFANVFVRRQPSEGFEPLREIIGSQEGCEMVFQLGMAVVVEAFDGGFLDCPVHPFNLSVGPGVLHFCKPVFDAVVPADTVEDVLEGVSIPFAIGELDAIVGEHSVDGVGDSRGEIAQELGGDHLSGLVVQFDEGELAGPIDRHEEIELALGCSNCAAGAR